jgi:WD40 repeat protein
MDLIFTSEGTTLFQVSASCVNVWDINRGQLRYICPGSLIGIARSNETFLTRPAKNIFKAWETATGRELPLDSITPESYAFHQRVVTQVKPPTLQILDVLKQIVTHEISLPHGFSQATLAPNDQYIVVVSEIDMVGHDFAIGECIDLNTGKVVYNFEAARCLSQTPLFFSVEHNLLIVGGIGNGKFALYDLATGECLREVWASLNGGEVVRVNPKNKWQVAIKVGKSIRLTDLHEPPSDKQSYYKGKVERTIKEIERIKGIAFHPNGELLASLLTRGEIHLWNVRVGELHKSLLVPLSSAQ